MASFDEEHLVPGAVELDVEIICLDCHPSRDIVACGLLNGDVCLHSYSATQGNELLRRQDRHKKSCRALNFSPCGQCLLTASADKSIKSVDVETGKLKRKIPKAHQSAIYSLTNTGENFIATGDEDGIVKVWDLRTKTATMEMKENEEEISDMIVDSKNKFLITTSGDSTLTCLNIRQKKLDIQSETLDSGLMCMDKCKRESKVVVGTERGELNIFNWGEWGNITDRIRPRKSYAVNCLVAATENILCAGCDDGAIRAVNVLPNRYVGVIGRHKGFPVEAMALTHQRDVLVTGSLDQRLCFWSVKNLKRIRCDPNKKPVAADKNRKLNPSKKGFFSDLGSASALRDSDDEDSDEDDSDSDSDLDSDD